MANGSCRYRNLALVRATGAEASGVVLIPKSLERILDAKNASACSLLVCRNRICRTGSMEAVPHTGKLFEDSGFSG
jgi:hypothetical protein